MISTYLAIAAVFFGILGYLNKNDDRLKYILFAQAAVLSAHYYLEGSMTAAIITLAIAPLNLLSAFKPTKGYYPLFALTLLGAGMLGYESARDVFPIAAVCISLYALYNLEGVKMRSILMLCSMMWIIHDVAYDLQIILFMDLMILILNIFGTIRLVRDDKSGSAPATALETRGLELQKEASV